MNRLRYDDAAVLLLTAAVALFYLFAQGTIALLLFANYGLIASVGLAGVFGLVSWARLGRSKPAVASLGFAVGLILWMFGLVVYTYTYLIAGADLPYLSLADVFYLSSYPPIIIGCTVLLRIYGSSLQKSSWLLIVAAAFLLCILVAVYVVLPSIVALESPLETIITALYPLLDIVILLLLLPLFFAFSNGVFRVPYAMLALGAFLVAMGDLVFTYVNLMIGYYDGHPIDLLWFTGCIAYGYGFWRQHSGFRFDE